MVGVWACVGVCGRVGGGFEAVRGCGVRVSACLGVCRRVVCVCGGVCMCGGGVGVCGRVWACVWGVEAVRGCGVRVCVWGGGLYVGGGGCDGKCLFKVSVELAIGDYLLRDTGKLILNPWILELV